VSRPRKWTENQFRSAIAESTSMAEVARALSLVRSGSTYGTINRWIAALNLDTSHFSGLGSAWASAKFGTLAPGCKICWRCRQEKPLSAFHRRGDGYQPACKACRAELDLARRDRCGCGNLKSHNRTRCQACRLSDVPDPRWEISVEHAVFAQQAGHQSSKLAQTEFESPPPI
jgi:hypothetical protein